MNTSSPNIRRILDSDVNRETKVFALQMLPRFEEMWGAKNLSVFWNIDEETIDFEFFLDSFLDRKNIGGVSLYMHDVVEIPKK